jgi:hypothetical protein
MGILLNRQIRVVTKYTTLYFHHVSEYTCGKRTFFISFTRQKPPLAFPLDDVVKVERLYNNKYYPVLLARYVKESACELESYSGVNFAETEEDMHSIEGIINEEDH